MPFAATWLDLEIIILSEVIQRKINICYTCMYNLKNKWYRWTYLQNRDRCRKQIYGYQRGKGEE